MELNDLRVRDFSAIYHYFSTRVDVVGTIFLRVFIEVAHAPLRRVQIWQKEKVDGHYNEFHVREDVFLELVEAPCLCELYLLAITNRHLFFEFAIEEQLFANRLSGQILHIFLPLEILLDTCDKHLLVLISYCFCVLFCILWQLRFKYL